MRFVFISDTHGKHDEVIVPPGDVLIHAGDVSSHGEREEVERFLRWYETQPHPTKILVAGNHDRFIENDPDAFQSLLPNTITYLQDKGVVIDGVSIWGCPMTPAFFDWAFMADIGPALKAHWARIPQHTDILITHGPPLGIMDEVNHEGDKTRAGCPDLRARIAQLGPAFHLFGHIHECYGQEVHGQTRFINASTMNEHYKIQNAPVTFDYP